MHLASLWFMGYRSNLHGNNTPLLSPPPRKKEEKEKKEDKTKGSRKVAHRFYIHRCLLCNRISIRFWARFTRHEIFDENKRTQHPSAPLPSPTAKLMGVNFAVGISKTPVRELARSNRVNEVTFYGRFQVLVAPGCFLCTT